MYASSTTTTGCTPSAAPATSAVLAASNTRLRSSGLSGVPVGLFGLVSTIMAGLTSSMALMVASTSRVKSALRCASFHVVNVSRAYSGYMEYVGSQPRAVRPGPPKAWNSCSMISLEPLAPHSWSTSSLTPDSRSRYFENALRSSMCSRSGYRLSVGAISLTRWAMVSTTAGSGAYGFSLTLRHTGTSSCGAPYGSSPIKSLRSGRYAGIALLEVSLIGGRPALPVP